MNILNKLERKFGKYAITNLMNYIIFLYIAGIMISMVNPLFYEQFLKLDIDKILHGQVWRLVTFLIQSPSNSNIIFLAIELYVYYMLGTTLERTWGAFRFNMYMLVGIVCNILATVVLYIATGNSYTLGLIYLNRSLFFAFAMLYPNVQFLLMFIIPVKVKYIAYFYAAFLGYNILYSLRIGDFVTVIVIVLALFNFLLFFFATRNYKRISPKEYKRRANYKRQTNQNQKIQGITRHKCAICGRTEEDGENLEFRFCSKCDGNYEYCQDHLFTHQHIKN